MLVYLRYLLTISSRVGRRECGMPRCPPLLPLPRLPPLPLWLWCGLKESGWQPACASVPLEKDVSPVEGALSCIVGRVVFKSAWFSCTRSLAFWMGTAERQEQSIMGIWKENNFQDSRNGSLWNYVFCSRWQTHLQAPHHFHSHSWSRNWPTASQEQSSCALGPQSDHRSWTRQPSPPCQSLETCKEHVSTLLSVLNSGVWLSSNCSVFDLTLTMVTASQSTQRIPVPAARGYICIPLCSSTVERVRTLRVTPMEPSVAPATASTPPSAPASASHSPVKKKQFFFYFLVQFRKK